MNTDVKMLTHFTLVLRKRWVDKINIEHCNYKRRKNDKTKCKSE